MSQHVFHSALLVEDELNLGQALEVALSRLCSTTRRATTLEQARARLKEETADFILLDRQLPDGDGILLCDELRHRGFHGCILMLTASGDTDARIEGLRAGADDYLPKPFSWEELEARIHALGRRKQAYHAAGSAASSTSSLWERDETRLRIHGPSGWVELTPLEFKLACHLIQAKGAIVSREELLKEVWGFHLLPKTRTVDFFLSRLRKHFEQNPEEPRHFLTIRGAGYRFQA